MAARAPESRPVPADGSQAGPSLDPDRLEVKGDPGLSTREARKALRGAESRPEVADALDRLGRTLVREGYLEAELRLQVGPDGGGTLHLDRGNRATWDTLLVSGPPARPADGPVLQQVRSQRFDPDRFEEILWEWINEWTEGGHPFAWARLESLEVNQGRVRAALRFDPGPRMAVEEVRFPGRTGTRRSFLERWIRFRPGRIYRESDWERARRRLEQIGLFEWVEPHLLARKDEGNLFVSIPVEEGLHNRLEGALGYSGRSRSLSGFADLELGNLFGTGRRLALLWEQIREDQNRLRLRYREPLLGPLPLGMRVFLEQEERDSTYSQLLAEARLEASVGTDVTVSAGLEYRRALLGEEPAERIRRVSSIVGISWDTIRPGRWEGGRFQLDYRSGRSRVRPPGGGQTRTWGLDRVESQGERFWQPGRGWAGKIRLLGAALSRSDSLPPSEALRLGGISSLRGYEEEELATRRYLSGQLEFGPALEEGRIYLFLDGAWFRPLREGASDADAVGYGFGIASESAARSVSLDLALRRGAAFREGRIHVRVQTRF